MNLSHIIEQAIEAKFNEAQSMEQIVDGTVEILAELQTGIASLIAHGVLLCRVNGADYFINLDAFFNEFGVVMKQGYEKTLEGRLSMVNLDALQTIAEEARAKGRPLTPEEQEDIKRRVTGCVRESAGVDVSSVHVVPTK